MNKDIKEKIREGYGQIAKSETSCCNITKSCCGGQSNAQKISSKLGYSYDEMNSVPEGANLGLGCGNPTALAEIKEGETVLDLGSGAGFDAFLAVKKVGPLGNVIGVDMTLEMVDKAMENAKKGGYSNVEFRVGEIEDLPVEDSSVDVIISNCVINLSPEKDKVFKEAYRVLKDNGRLMVSDIVLKKELPTEVKNSIEGYIGCLSGAVFKDEYLKEIEKAGFKSVEVKSENQFSFDLMSDDSVVQELLHNKKITPEILKEAFKSITSIQVKAVK